MDENEMAADKNKLPKQVKLSAKEADDLMQRLQAKTLSNKDVEVLLGLISFNAWLQERLSRAKLTVKKLRKLFGFKSESSKHSNSDNNETDSNQDNKAATDSEPDNDATHGNKKEQEEKIPKSPKWDSNQNHGRMAASEYTGCPIIEVDFSDDVLKSGFCPVCAESGDQAKLEYPDPSVLVILEGSPLVSGNRVQLKRAKCVVCETYFTAKIPDEFKDRPKYSHTAISTLSIQHYYAGQPFKRIEALQKAQGVPLPDST